MKQKIITWLRREKRTLWLLAVLLFLAGLISGVICFLKQDTFLPGMNGKGYKVVVSDEEFYCTLGRKRDNLLLRLSPEGELLSYYRSKPDRFIEEFKVYDHQIYAIVTEYHGTDKGLSQKLVKFSADRKTLKPQLLAQLDTSEKRRWKSLAVEEAGTILLAGFQDGRPCTAELVNGRFQDQLGEVWKEQEDLFANRIARNEQGDVAWIHMGTSSNTEEHGQLRFLLDGNVIKKVTSSYMASPNRMIFHGDKLYVSDSISGNIFQISKDQSIQCFSKEKVFKKSDSLQHKMNLANFTVFTTEKGETAMAGLWGDEKETRIIGNRLKEEMKKDPAFEEEETDTGADAGGNEWVIDEITGGQKVPVLYWKYFWPVFLVVVSCLSVLAVIFYQIFYGRRLASRLLWCEVAISLIILILVTAMQLYSHFSTVREEATHQLKLMASSMALWLTADAPMDDAQLSGKTQEIWMELTRTLPEEEQMDYSVRVIWKGEKDKYIIGYDEYYPKKYLIKDMEGQTYRNRVDEVVNGQLKSVIPEDLIKEDEVYQCMSYLSQGEREGCVIIRQDLDVKRKALNHISWQLQLALVICPMIFLGLLLVTRRLLSPLDRIQKGLEEFYTCGGGNQIQLKGIPHTELYEIGRVFNKLSLDTRIQKNELNATNQLYARMVPGSILKLLGIRSISALTSGKVVERAGNILILAALDWEDKTIMEAERVNQLVEIVGAQEGFMVDWDENLCAWTAIFSDVDQAIRCGHIFMSKELPVLPVVLEEPVSFGVFGGTHLLYPAILTRGMARRMAAIRKLRSFDAGMIRCGTGGKGMRLLGWDEKVEFYEELTWKTSSWKASWKKAAPIWQEAMKLYREDQMNLAARMFARVLLLMPEDLPARWYLFQCEKLRGKQGDQGKRGLLSEWEEEK